MARNQLTLLISFFFISLALQSVTSIDKVPAKHEKPPMVVVEGMVYCQSCERSGSLSLMGAEPISGAKVSVTCKDHKNKISYYKSFITDVKGYFYAELKDYMMTHFLLDHPLHACRVTLVSSPLDNCNLMSNINNGLSGAPLRYGNKMVSGRDYKAVVYAAGPLAFRPATCHPNPIH